MSTLQDVASPSAPDAPAGRFSGPITAISVPSLLQSIHLSRETGVLLLRDGRVEKSAYVHAGDVVFSRSNDPDDRLGELFLRRGVLSVRGLERCTAEITQTGHRLGGLLLQSGLITPEDLIEGVRDQVREIIHSMFLWTRGDYSFQMGPLPTDELITMRVNTTDLIRTGIQRITTWSRIREAIGGLETRYRTLPEFDVARSEITLCREEERLLQFLAQPGSVGEVCDTLNGNDFETCRTIWAFSIMGALERVRQA